jgi:hypothetical protein
MLLERETLTGTGGIHVIRKFGLMIVLLAAATVFPSSAAGRPGLVGHWKLDELEGIIAHDHSGNGNDGTVEGTAEWHPDEGQVDGALWFDGVENGVSIPYQSTFDITNELTITAWIRQVANNKGWILVRNTADDSHRYYGLYTGAINQEVTFHYQGASDALYIIWSSIDIDDYLWHHLALVVDYPKVQLFIDGKPQEERDMTEPMVSGEVGDIKIGRRDPGDYYFEGMIDDVRLYDEALTPDEVILAMEYYGGGAGTAEDPFLIYTAKQMNAIGSNPDDWNKHFRLMADIDLGEYDGRDSRPRFNIIGKYGFSSFRGKFDGQGHEISNFTYTGVDEHHIGLFGSVYGENAELKDIVLTRPVVNGGNGYDVAALVGHLDIGSSVQRCRLINGDISGGEKVGGLVGEVEKSTIADCSVRADVSGIEHVGGLAGVNYGGTITRSCFGGDVYCEGSNAGGMVGRNGFGMINEAFSEGGVAGNYRTGGLAGYNAGTIYNCYSKVSVEGKEETGGLVGYNNNAIICCYAAGRIDGIGDHVGGLVGERGDHSKVLNSYWDIQHCNIDTSAEGIGRTKGEMRLASTYFGWGCDGTWRIDEGRSAPTLAWEEKPGELLTRTTFYGGGTGEGDDPFLIDTVDHLNTIGLIACDWNKHFRLTADIDLSGYDGENGNPAFNVIGKYMAFTGVFDGGGHTISNFSCHFTGDSPMGLFGSVKEENAMIVDLILQDVVLSFDETDEIGGYSGGSLVGHLYNGTIRNCAVRGGMLTGLSGGLVGWMKDGTITHCYTRCIVSGSGIYNYKGGLVGILSEGEISNCYTLGSVTGTFNVGGLVGYLSNGKISDCYSLGTVSAIREVGGLVGVNYDEISGCFSAGYVSGEWCVGGLVGRNYRSISNCYATGRVEGIEKVGGLVGLNAFQDYNGIIFNCYATGWIEGQTDVGGLVGSNTFFDGQGSVTASFWDIETSGQADSDGGTGKTTAEMMQQETFSSVGWDFTTPVWVIIEGEMYPKLWWE